jgi:DnaK suppressor protein
MNASRNLRGHPSFNPMISGMDLAHLRQRLEEERSRRLALADRLRQEEADPVESSELSKIDQHPADLGTETFERELELTTLTIVEGELKDIDDALRRLEQGTYGICEECGKPIDEARLEAKPWARYCVVDQARVERALSSR